ncbi:MFS transporter [Kineobactrum salinum]|uniref:MFS transporter n=1 Tax=Kineobactrum salinum TaxID=2708301 RepID=A0A6C0TWH1_9GAMM|nr:MFS transporter [Kineobactrum salinum]QIB64121.1 MFS transporter [Kineobactrum salinum]
MLVAYAYSAWAVNLLMTDYGLGLGQAGMWFGISSGFGPVIGSLLLPALIRGTDFGSRVSSLMVICFTSLIVGTVIFVIAPIQPSVIVFLVCNLLGSILLFGVYSTVIVSMQFLANADYRATLVAGVTFVGSGVGLGAGPPLVGYFSMILPGGQAAALSLLAALAGILSVTLLFVAWRAAAVSTSGDSAADHRICESVK